MSGIEPILIGAGIGAAASGIMGGNPLQGALLGAAGGGLGGFAGGAGGAVGGTAGGTTGGVAGGTTGGVAGGAGGAVAQAFPVAMQAPIAATPLPAVGAGTASSATSSLTGNLLADMQAMDLAMAATGDGFAKTAGLGAGLLDKIDPMQMMQMGSSLLGDGKSQRQQVSSGGGVRQGKAPQVQAPIDELMRMQMMAQRQRRPISLLG